MDSSKAMPVHPLARRTAKELVRGLVMKTGDGADAFAAVSVRALLSASICRASGRRLDCVGMSRLVEDWFEVNAKGAKRFMGFLGQAENVGDTIDSHPMITPRRWGSKMERNARVTFIGSLTLESVGLTAETREWGMMCAACTVTWSRLTGCPSWLRIVPALFSFHLFQVFFPVECVGDDTPVAVPVRRSGHSPGWTGGYARLPVLWWFDTRCFCCVECQYAYE